MPLLVRSNFVKLVSQEGEDIFVPDDWAWVQDTDGRMFNRCTAVICPYTVEVDGSTPLTDSERKIGNNYFGLGSVLSRVFVELPSGPWHRRPDVWLLAYVRKGRRKPGGFHHPFKAQVRLYESTGRRKGMRLEMPDGCVMSARGIGPP